MEATERFDKVRPESVRVPASALAEALHGLDPDVRVALETSIDRARTAEEALARLHEQLTGGGRADAR